MQHRLALSVRAAGCPKQDDWEAFNEALGNHKAQEELRLANPEGKHCSLLMQSPNACVGCEHNPTREVEKHPGEDEYLANAARIERAIECRNLLDTGFQIPLSEIHWLTSLEVMALRQEIEAKRVADQEEAERVRNAKINPRSRTGHR